MEDAEDLDLYLKQSLIMNYFDRYEYDAKTRIKGSLANEVVFQPFCSYRKKVEDKHRCGIPSIFLSHKKLS